MHENVVLEPSRITLDKLMIIGFELAMRFLGNNNISVFYGSQRGGLICSNGTCAYYPGFEEGFKATLRINYDI